MSIHDLTPKDINARLVREIDRVAETLLPQGKRSGNHLKAGDVHGEAGQSLDLVLSGSSAGLWKDFATGEGGDLIDLFAAVHSVGIADAIKLAKDYLGIRDEKPKMQPVKKRSYTEPKPSKSVRKPQPESRVTTYLKGRGITAEAMTAYQVAEDGNLIVCPCKRDGKLKMIKFIPVDRHESGKAPFASKDSEPCLFGWQAIPDSARTVTITEGEIDAMSAWAYGYPALSVPFGGGAGEKQRWIEYDYVHLQRFDTIYLALDNDEPGQEAIDEIIKRLGRERCMVVRLPSKDFNEALQAMIPQENIDACYANAESMDPDKLVSVDSFSDEVHHMLDNPMETSGMPLPWDKAEHQLRLRPAETTIWTGWNGHGKSQLLGYVATYSALKHGAKFCIASMEMKGAITLLRMVRQAAGVGNPSHAFTDRILERMSEKVWLFNELGDANLTEMIEAFRYAAKRYGVDHFIVDSLAKLGMAEDDYNAQKKAINQLTGFAHEMNVHVHLVAHPRKGFDETRPPGKMDVRGGASLTDMADNVVTVWRNKAKEEETEALSKDPTTETKHQDEGDVHMVVSKQRGGSGWEGKIVLWFDRMSFQYMGRESHRPHPMINFSIQEAAA